MESNYPLPIQTLAAHNGANMHFRLTDEDLTEETVNTAQDITLFTAKAGSALRFVEHDLPVPFEDASDAAFNTNVIKIGDGSDDNRFLDSTEINVNGTEILKKLGPACPGDLTAATVSTADGSDAATTQTLANALKAEINKVIADLATLKSGPFYVFAADTDIVLNVGSMAAKALSDVDTGVVNLWFDYRKPGV